MQSNHSIATPESILSEWFAPFDQVRIEKVTVTTGISGSQVWKVTHGERRYCLKSWPRRFNLSATHASKHRLLSHVREQDFTLTPVASVTLDGRTVVETKENLWDLTTWMPGDHYRRSKLKGEKLQRAMIALARFHTAAHRFKDSSESPSIRSSSALAQRIRICRSLSAEDLQVFERLIVTRRDDTFGNVLLQIVDNLKQALPIVLRQLEFATERPLPQQWCLRDAKYDHILFQDGEPSAIIDFGAATVDSVACDIARLVGSLLDVTAAVWQAAIEAYCSVSQLSQAELEAVPLFDRGGVVAAASNWLRWLVVEQRQFENREAVQSQLEWLANRL